MQYLHRKSPFRNNQIRDLAGWIVGTWRTLLGIVDKSPEDSPHSASPRQDEAPKQQTGTSNQGHDVEPIPKLNTNGSSKDRNGHTKPSVSKETGGHKSPSSVSRNTESRQKSTAKGDDSKNEPKPAKPKESMNGRQSKSASHLKALMGTLCAYMLFCSPVQLAHYLLCLLYLQAEARVHFQTRLVRNGLVQLIIGRLVARRRCWTVS